MTRSLSRRVDRLEQRTGIPLDIAGMTDAELECELLSLLSDPALAEELAALEGLGDVDEAARQGQAMAILIVKARAWPGAAQPAE